MTNKQTRRAILAGAAALPALTLPAVAFTAAAPDPIFAAIEYHRAARDAWWGLNDKAPDEVSDDLLSIRGDAEQDALTDLLETRPTTVAGVIAVLRHVDQHLRQYEEEETQPFGNCTDPLASAGATFLATIAAALDAEVQS
jgi:hypothetical protein